MTTPPNWPPPPAQPAKYRWLWAIAIIMALLVAMGFIGSLVDDTGASTAKAGSTQSATATATPTENNPPAGESADAKPKQVAPKPTKAQPAPKPIKTTPPEPAKGTALAALDTLTIAGGGAAGYDRDLFGDAWLDVDGNGCDTRNDILARDLTDEVVEGDCRIETAVLDPDPYTGVTITFVYGGESEVDIDHVVALADGWRSGADDWGVRKRIAFANDPLNLLAVDASANRAKSDANAAEWLPDVEAIQCVYVARQVGVKAKYDLTVTDAEHAAMEAVLETCPEQKAITGGGPTRAPADIEPVPAPQPEPEPAPEPDPEPEPAEETDPIFDTCGEANDNGYGDYVRGQDPEYDYYDDRDGDGLVCET